MSDKPTLSDIVFHPTGPAVSSAKRPLKRRHGAGGGSRIAPRPAPCRRHLCTAAAARGSRRRQGRFGGEIPCPRQQFDRRRDQLWTPAGQIGNLGQRVRQNGQLRSGVWRHGRLSSTRTENANNGAIAPKRPAAAADASLLRLRAASRRRQFNARRPRSCWRAAARSPRATRAVR
jgi:hypothetical protein